MILSLHASAQLRSMDLRSTSTSGSGHRFRAAVPFIGLVTMRSSLRSKNSSGDADTTVCSVAVISA